MRLAYLIYGATVFTLVAALPASAYWQFARWGMTSEQVIKASHGKASWTTRDGKQVVTMPYPSGEFDLNVSFGFDESDHLKAVGVTSSSNAYDIVNQLKGKYGKPTEASADDRNFIWYTAEDRIVAQRVGGANVFIIYTPRTTRDASGL
jgi:hypothetical protein